MRTARSLAVLAIAFTLFADTHPAVAVDAFGMPLFGDSSAVPEGALAYNVAINVAEDGDGDLKALISDVSRLNTQKKHGAGDAFTLVARARGDVAQIQAALYSEGYYAGDIGISIAGQKIEGLDPSTLKFDSGTSVEVVIDVTAGDRFVFGDVSLSQTSRSSDADAPRSSDAPNLTGADLGLATGKPAKSGEIIVASEKLVEAWRTSGFPLARIADQNIAADHARKAVDVHFKVDPGPPAVYGWVGVSGAPTLDHQTVLEQSKLTPGRRFRPSDLKRARDRLVKMPSVESVRIVEGRSVDAGGGLPVNLEVIERKPRYFGATASVSTTDGAEVEAHWGHRNFFGQGEHLRVEGTVSRIGSEDISQLEFDAAAIYTKPGILDVDTDLFSEFRVTREHPDAYESMDGGVKVGLARVFNPNLSGSIALAAKFSRVDDAFGTSDYLLVSLPVEAAYDTRDNRVDATRGVSISGALIPTADTISGATFVKSEFHAAAYRSLDGDGRAVLAGRVSAGSVAGASLADVPASTRFFAGGGGSVRGYEYRSLGPTIDGEVIGGLGYVGATAELRLRVSDSFGLVPFIDFASVTDKAWPSLDGDYYVGAGLGLRYYTALGPLRIDVATPLTECDNNPTVAVYVGLGQSF